MTPKKVLVIVSDQGFHWDEFGDALHAFQDMHWQVDVASPRGHPKAEPLTLRRNMLLHFVGRGTTASRGPKTAWWGRPIVEAIMRTKSLDAVQSRIPGYDAVYVAGGLGELEDLENCPALSRILKTALDEGLWIAGRKRILMHYPDVAEGVDGQVLVARTPLGARANVWRLIEAVAEPEDVHGRTHVAEFLDRKSGVNLRRFS